MPKCPDCNTVMEKNQMPIQIQWSRHGDVKQETRTYDSFECPNCGGVMMYRKGKKI